MRTIKPSKSALTSHLINTDVGIFNFEEVEQKFDALERELVNLYEQVPFGLHSLDKTGIYRIVNDTELAWLGFTAAEVVGLKTFAEQLTLECKDKYQRYIENAAGGYLGDIELSLIDKDGGIRHVSLYSKVILDNIGRVDKYRSVLFNIDERKAMEAGLLVAAAAFETQEGIFVTDAHTVILRVNNAFTTITGFSAEEVIGKKPNIFSSGRHDISFYSEMWGRLNSTGKWSGEVYNRRKSGEVYPEFLSITAVKGHDGIISNYVGTLTDISTINAAAEEIRNLAFYDPLTQVPNRRLFIDRLKIATSLSGRTGQGCALLFLDLDHFKTLNDTLGHDMGDQLLQQVADRLTHCVREGDTVARLGGDEFVVLLVGLSDQLTEYAATTQVMGEKLIALMSKPFQLQTYEYHITVSIGVTLFSGQGLAMDELLKQADIAMYQAKSAGRNGLRFFDPKMQQVITERVTLEHELLQALRLQQFQLYYQVQVDDQGRPIGAEALIRWFHPERGVLLPYEFIPVAEETQLIITIGQRVLDIACAQLKTWEQNALTRDLTLSVNVSSKQFHDKGFVTVVKSLIQQHGINPKRLKLELTESALSANVGKIILAMAELKEAGIGFELDDFGTGYSSLQYLKALPLYRLKIDQSFVRDIALDSSDQAIVRTIVAMAKNLKLSVIAEGVETEEQRLTLLNKGCRLFQGYLFGKPLPIGQFEALLISKIT